MAPATANAQPAKKKGGGWDFRSIMFYGIIAFTVINSISSVQKQQQQASGLNATGHDLSETRAQSLTPAGMAPPNRRLIPLARPGDSLDILISVDEDLFQPVELIGLPFDFDFIANHKINESLPLNLAACVAKNCSADLHVSWTLRGKTFAASAPFIRFYGTKVVEKHHLIGGGAAGGIGNKTLQADGAIVYRAYVQPVVTISPIIDFTTPLPTQFEGFTPVVDDTLLYGPAIHINNFWVIRDHLLEVNATTAAQPFELTLKVLPITALKMSMYQQFEQTMKSQRDMGLASEESADETKRIFLDTNPYLLALTGLVTLLHMLFEYLAFANDIKFWRGRKDFKGLSLRTVAMNCYFQTIIFLYLVESNETSWTILLPSGFGVLAEYWKLTQCVIVTKRSSVRAEDCSSTTTPTTTAVATSPTPKKSAALSAFGFEVRFSESYDQRTRKLDDTAIRWLIYSMIPMLLGYSVYSAVYKEHRSWYAYLIYTQVQFIYFFGFAMMCPQIFINYKLKSVGQLPWRTFVYKALNTVIDDLFAFIIKMPWLHRIACFRDDVVFVIILYQRWIYPVDMTRLNDDEDPIEELVQDDAAEGVAALEQEEKKNR